jgi:hypothetical protein
MVEIYDEHQSGAQRKADQNRAKTTKKKNFANSQRRRPSFVLPGRRARGVGCQFSKTIIFGDVTRQRDGLGKIDFYD